jgi:amylovoran biosynthesis glycosyltransferase AmsD
MKTIYFIINDISMSGGLSRVVLNLYEQFKQNYSHKYKIQIISATIQDNHYRKNNDTINLQMDLIHGVHLIKKILWYAKFLYKLNKFLKTNSPHVVVGIGTMMNLSLCFYMSKDYLLYGAEHTAYDAHNKLILGIRKYLYKRLDKIISLTKIDEKKYKQLYSDVVTIPNFTSFYTNTNFITNDIKNILYIGRFTSGKGVFELIDIMTRFYKTSKEWTLTMIGEGPFYENILDMIKSKNMEKYIFIKQPTRHIEKEYLNCSIFALASKVEGFPMVLLEAKSYGIPVVSFDCPTGPSDIIKENEDGFLVPLGDNDIFLERLHLLADNVKLRKSMSLNARKNIYKFHPTKIMKKWEKIFDE